jgi:hypothetical protein
MYEYEMDPVKVEQRRRWLPRIVVVGVALFSLALILHLVRTGVSVTVKNTGTKPIRSVVVHITGNAHELGDIAPGESVKGTVYPTGESGLYVEFNDTDGKQQRLDVDCYMEHDYRGMIQVAVKDGRIDQAGQRIDVRPY